MASTKPLLALAVTLLIGAPACAATPPGHRATQRAAEPGRGARLHPGRGRAPAPHRRHWDAESRTFFVSTYNEGILYRGGLDDSLTPVFLRGQPGQTRTASGSRADGSTSVPAPSTGPRVRPRDPAADRDLTRPGPRAVIDLDVTGPATCT